MASWISAQGKGLRGNQNLPYHIIKFRPDQKIPASRKGAKRAKVKYLPKINPLAYRYAASRQPEEGGEMV